MESVIVQYIVLYLAALAVSGLTLFSGFGLGTLLMPVFAIFFPIEIAVAMTAVVHLANNLFKVEPNEELITEATTIQGNYWSTVGSRFLDCPAWDRGSSMDWAVSRRICPVTLFCRLAVELAAVKVFGVTRFCLENMLAA